MSETTQQAPEQPTVEHSTDPDPFAGNSRRFKVSKEINVGQLQDEIARRLKAQVSLGLATDDPDHIASQARPATLYVSPKDVPPRLIEECIDAHIAAKVTPANQAGSPSVGPAPATIDPSVLPEDVQSLVQKLAEGKDLKMAEANDVLRAILGIGTGKS